MANPAEKLTTRSQGKGPKVETTEVIEIAAGNHPQTGVEPWSDTDVTYHERFMNLGCIILLLYFPWTRRGILPSFEQLVKIQRQLQYLYAQRCADRRFDEEDFEFIDECLLEMIVEHANFPTPLHC